MTKLLAFHGKQKVKSFYVGRVKLHTELDEIIKGMYWGGSRGCAIGCTIHGDNHADYETKIGIPESIAHLEEEIFEALPLEEAKVFPLQFIEAVPVGADLSKVSRQMCVFALDQRLQYALPDGKNAIDTMLPLLRRSLDGDEPTDEEWCAAQLAESAAWLAVRPTTFTIPLPVAARAAATRTAAWLATRPAAIIAQRDELLRLLHNAPIGIVANI